MTALAAIRTIRISAPILACLLLGVVIGLGIWAARLIPAPSPSVVSPLVARLFQWDAGWYLAIAEHGYGSANLAIGGVAGLPSRIAFFPLYPLFERLLVLAGANFGGLVLLIPAITFGFLSIFLFSLLARIYLPPVAAGYATLSYALCPGALFFIAGYPTSVMNACAIASFILVLRRQWLMAAAFCGLATAAGPLPAFIAAALVFGYFAQNYRSRSLLALFGRSLLLAVISLAGLLCFMAYQQAHFGTMFAFVDVQSRWNTMSLFHKYADALHAHAHTHSIGNTHANTGLAKTVTPNAAGMKVQHGLLARLFTKLSNPQRIVSYSIQIIDIATLLLTVAAYAALGRRALRHRYGAQCLTVLGAGGLVLFGYLWLIFRVLGPVSTSRLLYLSCPAFLAAGILSQTRPCLTVLLLAAEASALLLQIAFFVVGYSVT